ncbi:MAG TPA: MerR family DNA-binding protein, partial [Sporichthyaceae bacterium]
IKRAQQLGFTLDDVEELLHLDRGGPHGCEAARELTQARLTDLQARIADLGGRCRTDPVGATCVGGAVRLADERVGYGRRPGPR